MKNLTRTFMLSAALVAAASAGCTLESIDAPPLTGPSTFALDLAVTATPDILVEDGVASSVIRIVARDHNNQPVPNLRLRVDTVKGSEIVDVGQLSARDVTTNASGEASVTFTAPRSSFFGADSQSIVNVRVLPFGTDFGTSFERLVRIRLVPPSVVLEAGAPTPSFTFFPSQPTVGERVFFDASSSQDDGTIVRFQWTYGDGEFEEGVQNHKDYVAPGTYFVTLTVTDNEGKKASLTQALTVS